MKANNIVGNKSKAFAIQMIKLYKQLCEEQKEFVMSKQLLRAATSIGANIAESEYAQSEADFLSKRYISLKEAAETLYWLELLHDSNFISSAEFEIYSTNCQEIIRLLVSSIKTLKTKHEK